MKNLSNFGDLTVIKPIELQVHKNSRNNYKICQVLGKSTNGLVFVVNRWARWLCSHSKFYWERCEDLL
jgi:hypothetical protein